MLLEFENSLHLLTDRLEETSTRLMEPNADPMLFFAGKGDSVGQNMGCHIEYVSEIVRALNAVLGRKELYVHLRTAPIQRQLENIRNVTRRCALQLNRFGLDKLVAEMVKLDRSMRGWGISGSDLSTPEKDDVDDRVESCSPAKGKNEVREAIFIRGWSTMCEVLESYAMGLPVVGPRVLLQQSPTELAMLFGSQATPGNHGYAALRELMMHLSQKHCDRQVKMTALMMVRAVLYVMPDCKSMTDETRKIEMGRFARNEPPSHQGSPDFAELQTKIASIGAVNTVFCNMQYSSQTTVTDSEEVLGALRLAVSLLEGGNRSVQDLVCDVLEQPASQDFFKMVCALLDMSLDSVKEEKRREKQRKAEHERRVLAEQGMGKKPPNVSRNPPELAALPQGADDYSAEAGADGETAVVFTLEIVKLIRMLCQGQHKGLQDILRRQLMNRESVDLFQECVKFLSAVEPVIKISIDRGVQMVPNAMTRCFLMLGDAMHGPNRSNQQSVSNTGIFDLADRIMAKIRVTSGAGKHSEMLQERRASVTDSVSRIGQGLIRQASQVMGRKLPASAHAGGGGGWKRPTLSKEGSLLGMLGGGGVLLRKGSQFGGFDETMSDTQAGHVAREKNANEVRTMLKTSVLKCLLAFLEGSQRDDEVPQKMLRSLHWENFANQMNQCFRESVEPTQVGSLDPKP